MRFRPGRSVLQALFKWSVPHIKGKTQRSMRRGQGYHSGKEFPALRGSRFRLLHPRGGTGSQRIKISSTDRKNIEGDFRASQPVQ